MSDFVKPIAPWSELPLRRVGKIVNGGTPRADDEFWNGEIPFITPPDLRPVVGRTVTHTERTLTDEGVRSGSNVVPAGSVVLSIRAPIGYVALTSSTAAFNQGCRAILPSPLHDARFITYALMASSEYLDSIGRGTTFMEISSSQLAEVCISTPPQNEQRAIADYLDHETERIDELIAEQRGLIETLRERRVSVVDQAVVGAMTAQRPLVQDTGFKWLGEIPRNWSVRPLWSMFERIKDVGHPEEVMLSVFRDYGVIKKDSRDNLNLTAENRNIYQMVDDGWFVVNRMKAWQGSVGVSSLRGILSGHYICFRPRHAESSAYLNWLFRSSRYKAGYQTISRGVRPGQAEIDNGDLRVLPVLVPPIEEQLEISAYLEDQTSRIDALIAESEDLIALSLERRAALITAAVTGQIDVRTAA